MRAGLREEVEDPFLSCVNFLLLNVNPSCYALSSPLNEAVMKSCSFLSRPSSPLC